VLTAIRMLVIRMGIDHKHSPIHGIPQTSSADKVGHSAGKISKQSIPCHCFLKAGI
jgi:hypothetical protein